MKHTEIVDLSHVLLKAHLTKNDIVVDATMGKGQDTVFLASLVKHVYAFDIQSAALEQTIKALEAHDLSNVTLFHESHENIVALVPHFKGVIFNLGYMPTGDHTITTTSETTIKSLDMILSVLPSEGFILLVVYPGHQEGFKESVDISNYLKLLDTKQYSIVKIDMPYQHNHPPYILWIQKR